MLLIKMAPLICYLGSKIDIYSSGYFIMGCHAISAFYKMGIVMFVILQSEDNYRMT